MTEHFGFPNSYVLPVLSNNPTQINDLCEVFAWSVFDKVSIFPALQFPSDTPFLTADEFYDKYNLQLAADNSGPTTGGSGGGGGGAG